MSRHVLFFHVKVLELRDYAQYATKKLRNSVCECTLHKDIVVIVEII